MRSASWIRFQIGGTETDSAPSRSRIKAYMWTNLAGHDVRDMIAEGLTAAELEEAQTLSSECLKKKYRGC